jgi:hypothetical protein
MKTILNILALSFQLSTLSLFVGCCTSRTDLPLPPVRYVEPMPMRPASALFAPRSPLSQSQAVSASPLVVNAYTTSPASAGSAGQQPNHGAGIISQRYPHAFVKTTPTGLLLRSEANWKGHARPVAEVAETSGQRWLLVEPDWSLPPSVVPSTNNFVTRLIVHGQTNTGVWFQGRTVVIP